MNVRQLGYRFEKQWQETLNREFEWVYKLPDARAMKGFNMPYAPKVVCDFIAVDRTGLTHYFECKQTAKTALDFKAIKEHQLRDLCFLQRNGVPAYFIINFNNRKRGKERRNVLYKVKALQLLRAQILYSKTRVSIPINWFEQNCEKYKWIKKGEEYGWYRNSIS